MLAGGYVAINALFALAYLLVGGVAGMRPGDFADAFLLLGRDPQHGRLRPDVRRRASAPTS